MQESVIYQELREEAYAEGIKLALVAINLIKNGMAVKEVVKVTGLTMEQVQLLH